MADLIAVEINCETQEVIERPFTAEEVKAYEASVESAKTAKAAEDKAKADKETAKAELLAKLGITQEEAALLLA
jgi:hypothetical protein